MLTDDSSHGAPPAAQSLSSASCRYYDGYLTSFPSLPKARGRGQRLGNAEKRELYAPMMATFHLGRVGVDMADAVLNEAKLADRDFDGGLGCGSVGVAREREVGPAVEQNGRRARGPGCFRKRVLGLRRPAWERRWIDRRMMAVASDSSELVGASCAGAIWRSSGSTGGWFGARGGD